MTERMRRRETARQKRINTAVFWAVTDLAVVGAVSVMALMVEAAFKVMGV